MPALREEFWKKVRVSFNLVFAATNPDVHSDVLHRHVKGHGQNSASPGGDDNIQAQSSSESLKSGSSSHTSPGTAGLSNAGHLMHASPPQPPDDSTSALSIAAELTQITHNPLSASSSINPWGFGSENTAHSWNGSLCHDSGGIHATANHADPSTLPGSELLSSWLAFSFDWNLEIPELIDDISPPESSSQRLAPTASSFEESRSRFTSAREAWSVRSKGREDARSIWERIASSPAHSVCLTPGCEDPYSRSRRVDEACRQRLSNAITNALASTHLAEDHTSSQSVLEFPCAETLEYALDQYFVYFHASLPFIHIPTFSTKSAPTPLLLSMCLIGLMMLRNGSSSDFLESAFDVRRSGKRYFGMPC